MPELPEVETIRQDLKKVVLKKQIKDVIVKKPKLTRPDKTTLKKNLIGQKFTEIDRIGKLLIFSLDNDKHLLVHLKMTGQLIFQDQDQLVAGGHNFPEIDEMPNKYTHITIRFKDDSYLYYNDLRQFGYLQIATKKEVKKIKEAYGIEPLTKNFTFKNFSQIFSSKRTANLKSTLLNQKIVSGLGNIYVDEICHEAGIKPSRKANKLTKVELKRLFKITEKIIKKAIQYRGTTFKNYRDSSGKKGNFSQQLKVYGQKDKLN